MNNQGFTLIEMLMSVLIISIIATMVTINLVDEVHSSELSTAAEQMQAMIEGTRSCAMALNQPATIKFGASKVIIDCGLRQYDYVFEQITITTNFPDNTARFNQQGIINQAATIDMCNDYGCKKLTIAVGRSDVQIK